MPRRPVVPVLVLALLAVLIPIEAGQEAAPGVAIEEVGVAKLRDDLAAGRTTSRQLVERYLARIDAVDRRDPELRSVIETNPDALAIADALDAERRAGKVRGPLHGIPVLIKDNIDTGDRMATSAGSLALAAWHAPADAFVVARLREAGAVILGKTNLSEWANFRSTHSSSGWSGRGGQVRNPYVLDRNPCGSSSGTGAAIAASLATVGVGTETDGSIVCPSGANGLVGIKPTVGLVSRTGIIPISHSQDTAGPMARTVEDAALLLGAMTGVDPADTATGPSADHRRASYADALDSTALRGARIGVARARFFGYSPEADRLVEQAIADMRAQGAVIVDPADIPSAGELDDCEMIVLQYEFKAGLNDYLARLPASAPVRTLAGLIAFNERERAREMPFFGQELLILSEARGPLTDAVYRRALARCRAKSRTGGLDAAFARFEVDAFVAPTGSPAWTTDLVNGDHFVGSSSTPAAVAGYPSITVPAGQVRGLPVGLSFIGPAWSEARLIALAYAYEQATSHRRPPVFLPSLSLDAR